MLGRRAAGLDARAGRHPARRARSRSSTRSPDAAGRRGRRPRASAGSTTSPRPSSAAEGRRRRHLRVGGRARRDRARARSRSRRCSRRRARSRSSQDRLVEKDDAAARSAIAHRAVPRGRRRAPTSTPRSPRLGLPAVLKTRRGGYDGKGQAVLRAAADVDAAWTELGGVPLILEGVRRRSTASCRSSPCAAATARSRCWPVVENEHRDGILRVTRAPAPGSTARCRRAPKRASGRCSTTLDYVGVVLRRAVRRRRRAARQRDRAARAQQRALDDRGRGDEPVREPPARGRSAGRSARPRARGAERDGQLHRHDARPRRRARASRARTSTTTARRRAPAASSATSRVHRAATPTELERSRSREVVALVDG